MYEGRCKIRIDNVQTDGLRKKQLPNPFQTNNYANKNKLYLILYYILVFVNTKNTIARVENAH